MATVERDLEDFVQFAKKQIDGGGQELSLDELFDMWRIENPNQADHSSDVAAVEAAIADFRSGDRGRIAGELSDELRKQYGLPKE